jgi:multidrug efflux system membrane fusion protein
VSPKLPSLPAGLRRALLLCALGACSDEAPPVFERPPAPVVLATAAAQDVPVYLDEIGRCAAREVVSVQPQVSGRITERFFEDGADLKAGDALYTIDPRPYQARLSAAQAAVAEAKARQNWTGHELSRVESLPDARAIAKADVDARHNAVAVAEAQVAAAEAALASAQLDLEYCSIRSPIDGRAGQRLVDVGNVVKANEGVLLVIQRLDPLYADFTIAENNLSAVQRNMAGSLLRVEVRLPDDAGPPRLGELTFLDNAVQGSTGTLRLRATFPNEDHHFWPGRFVRVRLLLEVLKGAVLVPASATQLSATGPFVYVVGTDDTAELRPVVVGQRQGEHVVISSGLAAGERVVVEGQLGVTPGGKVRAVETPVAVVPPGEAPAADAPAGADGSAEATAEPKPPGTKTAGPP